MAKGSNDLNMLLSARVVKLKVELDAKGSKLPSQVNAISTMLKDKPVKLKVKLEASMKDLNKQISDISGNLSKSKSFKPLKLSVVIDVKGSAKNIQGQLKDVYKTVEDFNKKYGQQLKQMQNMQQKAQQTSKGVGNLNIPTSGKVVGFNNIKQYVDQLARAKDLMKGKFGNGVFSSFEMKDAKGNLTGFIATLERADGVVQKVRYAWDQKKGQFSPIDRQTITNSEKALKQSMSSLQELGREMDKLGKHAGKFRAEYNQMLSGQGLSKDAVNDLKRRLKDEAVSLQNKKKNNDLLIQEKRLIEDIKKASFATKDTSKRVDYSGLINQARKASKSEDYSGELKRIRLETDKITESIKRQANADKENQQILKEKLKMQQELKRLAQQIPTSSKNVSQQYIAETKAILGNIKSTKDLAIARERLNGIKDGRWSDDMARKTTKMVDQIERKLRRLKEVGVLTAEQFDKAMQQMANNAGRNFGDLSKQLDVVSRKLKQKEEEMKRIARESKMLLNGSTDTSGAGRLKSAVNSGDIARTQALIGTILKGKVETVDMQHKTDALGRAITQMTVKMAGAGKTVRTYTLEMERANGTLRQTAEGVGYNANRNLGIFEQLRIAMARVPIWMASMTAFYGTIRSVQAMTGEILKIDKAMTDLRRVASDKINIETVFEGAIDLSAELGNNIHDIMASLVDFSRTYGDFNERQLLAITKTAVLMSNVSDLTAQEATESLVGTMNAFNITAEDSIRIVDSLNEVDNDYAISTKQLAQGLQKSASTARTFGVTLEENIGHITAIGGVTMESGNIIGNSLKTIYSRITTIDEAQGALRSAGVEIYKIGEAGEKAIKPVSVILSDLASKWTSLSDEQRQNLAVTLAGRYQLSRFLAMMNNWRTVTKATATALSAEGSAMRENAKYMDSYEARINKLKNAFTEMSLSIGGAVLNGAIFAVVEGLASLAKGTVDFVDKWGALPAIGVALGALLVKMGVFKAMFSGMAGLWGNFRLNMQQATVSATGFQGAVQRVGIGLAGMTPLLGGASGALVRFGLAVKAVSMSILSMAGIGAIFFAIGVGIEKLVNKYEKQKRIAEKVEKANKQLIDSYRNTEGGLQALVDKQAELQRAVDTGAIKEGTDAYNEYVKVTNEVAKAIPTAVKYIDQAGLAHLRESEAIKEQISLAKELSDLKASEDLKSFDTDLGKNLQKYQDEIDKIKELKKEIKELKAENGKEIVVTDEYGQTYKSGMKKDNEKDIQKNNIEIIQSEQKKAEYLQKNMLLIQNTTLSYLESQEQLQYLSDTGKTVIEDMVQQNESLLRYSGEFDKNGQRIENSIEEQEKRARSLFEISKDMGEAVANTYKSMTQNVDDPMKLEEIQTNLDNVVKSLPEAFFKMEDLQGADVLKDKFQGVLDVSKEIQNGSGDWDGIIASLEGYGFSTQEAKAFTAQLGFEYDNQILKQKAMTQANAEGTDGLKDWIDTAIEAIDVSSQLFNYNDEDVSSLKSHVDNLKAMKLVYGENAEKVQSYKDSLEAISLFTGLPEEVIAKDEGHLGNVLDLMGKIELKRDETTGKIIGFDKEGLNKNQIKELEKLIWLGNEYGAEYDLITKKITRVADGVELVIDKQGKVVEKVKETNKEVAKTPPPSKLKDIYDETGVKADQTKNKVKELNEAVKDPNAVPTNKMKAIYDEVGTSASNNKPKVDELNKAVKDPTVAPTSKMKAIYDELGASASNNKPKVDEINKAVKEAPTPTGKLKGIYDEVGNSASNNKPKVDEINKSVEAFNKIPAPTGKWKNIYDEAGASSDSSKAKVDELTTAIQKASTSAQVLGTLESMIKGTADKAGALSKQISDLALSFSTMSQQVNGINAVATAITKVTSGAQNAQSTVAGAFNAIGANIKNIAVSASGTTNSMNILTTSIGRVALYSSTSIGVVASLGNALRSLSMVLVSASSSSRIVAQSLGSISQTFNSASNSVKNFTSALQAGVNASNRSANASRANASAKREEASAIIHSSQSIKEMSASYTKMASSAVSAVGKIKSAINSQRDAVSKLRDVYVKTVGSVHQAFSNMASIIKSRTSSAINTHNSQKSAIDRLKSSANEAKNAIMNMNSNAKIAMSNMSRYIAVAQDAQRASQKATSASRSVPSGGGRAIAQSIGTSGVAGAISAMSTAVTSTFSATAGEGSTGTSGGDSGTSGVMQQSIYSGLNLDGQYQFTSLATKEKEEKAELFKPDFQERQFSVWKTSIAVLEAKMAGLNKSSLEYRNHLKTLINLENGYLALQQRTLKTTIDRNRAISKRLKQLGNTSKHTKAQRDEYNRLQQEFDTNQSKISSLRTEIESSMIEIKKQSLEIFTDFVSQIVTNYDSAMSKVKARVDDIDFKIDVTTLTDPDNKKKLMENQIDKADELVKEQGIAENKKETLQGEYNKAVKKYGTNSDQAKAVKEELDKAKEEWEDATLAVLQAEKDIKDTRAEIADEGISQLKDYYSNMKDMAIDAIDAEQEALKKAYDEKMDMYDGEIDKINSVYDEKFKSMDKEKASAEYQEELDSKQAKRAELVNKISLLSRDTSVEGRKKLEELKKELAEQEKDIADFQKERQDELLRESLNEQKDGQIEDINAKKEAETKFHEKDMSDLDKQKEDITKQYDDLLNNDKYWADMRNSYIKGSFEELNRELAKMNQNLFMMDKGVYKGLFGEYEGLSSETKQKIAEDNALLVDNMRYSGREAYDNARDISSAGRYEMTDGYKRNHIKPIANPTETTPAKKTTSKTPAKKTTSKTPAKKSSAPAKPVSELDRQTTANLNFRKTPAFGQNIMETLPKGTKVDFIAMEKEWAKIKHKGKVGYVSPKYLKKFDTGGYTGNDVPKEGALAILHRKEQVMNEDQTKDIFNTVKLVEKFKRFIPDLKVGNTRDKLAMTNGLTSNVSYGDINVTIQGGDKKKAKDVAKEILTEIKKTGRR